MPVLWKIAIGSAPINCSSATTMSSTYSNLDIKTANSSSTEQPTTIPTTLKPISTTLSPSTLDPTSSLNSQPTTTAVQLPPPPSPPVGTSPSPTTATVDIILNSMTQYIPTDKNSITIALYEEMITSFLQKSLLTMNTLSVTIQNIQYLSHKQL